MKENILSSLNSVVISHPSFNLLITFSRLYPSPSLFFFSFSKVNFSTINHQVKNFPFLRLLLDFICLKDIIIRFFNALHMIIFSINFFYSNSSSKKFVLLVFFIIYESINYKRKKMLFKITLDRLKRQILFKIMKF